MHVAQVNTDLCGSAFASENLFRINLTDEEKKKIYKLVYDIGFLFWPVLIKNHSVYREIGNSLDSVNPLQFIGYILSEPILKQSIDKIMGNRLKRYAFVTGLTNKLGKLKLSGEIEVPYVDAFAREFNKDPSLLVDSFVNEDWNGFISEIVSVEEISA